MYRIHSPLSRIPTSQTYEEDPMSDEHGLHVVDGVEYG